MAKDNTGQTVFVAEIAAIAAVAGGLTRSWAVGLLAFVLLVGLLSISAIRIAYLMAATLAWGIFAGYATVQTGHSVAAALTIGLIASLLSFGAHIKAFESLFGSTGFSALDPRPQLPDGWTPDAEADDIEPPKWKPKPIRKGNGWTGVINYRNEYGDETTRTITVKYVDVAFRVPMILAHCHMRDDDRHFRFDRVLNVADRDGVVIDRDAFFVQTLGVRWRG